MGGGVMRTATSRVAGIGGGVFHGGLRPAAPPVEQALRKSPMPASAMLSSSSSSAKGKATVSDVAPIQRAAWETDDLIMAAGEPMPRVVFQGAPSFDEAKDATVELKDALDKVYLSSPESSVSAEVAATNQLSGLSLFSNRDSDTESCLVVETARGRPVPNPAMKAFKLLSTSPEAQTVVASIASDPHVWTAVMQNPVLQDFMKSNQTPPAEFQEHVFSENLKTSHEGTEAGDSENWFSSMLENVKLTVIHLVSSLSSSLQNIFGFSLNDNADTKTTAMDITIGASFMGLVTLVAMVVLLKRV